MDDLKQENITISAVEQNQYGFKVKSEKNMVFNVTANKQDGTPTKAYEVLTALPNNGMGLQKCFKFAEVENKQGGTSRYVRMIVEPEATQSAPAYTPSSGTSPQSYTPKKEEPNWEDINFGKCKHAFLVEAYKQYKTDSAITLDMIEKQAEIWATMSMRKTPKTPGDTMREGYDPQETTPLPQDDIAVETIPF